MAADPGPLAAPLLLLVLVPLTQWAGQWSQAQLVRALGWWGVPLTTGWIGVPVHELAHAVVARLLQRQVSKIHWFSPDADTGTLGAVQWQPGRGPLAWLAMLAVGWAPLVGGALLLRGLLHAVAWASDLPLPTAPASADLQAWHRAAAQLLQWALGATEAAWRRDDAWAWLAPAGWWTLISVAAHMTPSPADLRGAWRGALLLTPLAVAAVLLCQAAEIPWQPAVLRNVTALTWLLAPGLGLALATTLGVGMVAAAVAALRRR